MTEITQPRYQVRLPDNTFEGPLDLLLQVIERNELPVTAISLATIADQYLDHLRQLSQVNPAELAEFLVIAAKLLLIKSQALLPATPSRTNDSEDAAITAEELVAQLREYKSIKAASIVLRQRQEAGLRGYTSQRIGATESLLRQITADLEAAGGSMAGTGLQGLTLKDLITLTKRRLAQQQQQQLKLPMSITAQSASSLTRKFKIEDKMSLLRKRLQVSPTVDFSSLFDRQSEPSQHEIIVTFMAVLEMLRMKQVRVNQPEPFGDISIENES